MYIVYIYWKNDCVLDCGAKYGFLLVYCGDVSTHWSHLQAYIDKIIKLHIEVKITKIEKQAEIISRRNLQSLCQWSHWRRYNQNMHRYHNHVGQDFTIDYTEN